MANNGVTAKYLLVFKDLASRGLFGVAKSARYLVSQLGSANGALSKLGSVTHSVAKIGGTFAAISGAVVGSTLIKTQREFDVLNSSLLTAMGSTDAAAKKFKELNEFAQRTPYTLAQSVNGFVQLKNLGLDPSIKTMEAYGNMASAMGKDLSQMIEAVADASTLEFERLKEFGIKAKQDKNSDTVSFTFQGQTKTMRRTAKNIQKYLLETAAKFNGSMANRMATLDGAFANFGQNFSNVVLRISQSGIGEALASVLNKASGYLTEFYEYMGSDEGKKQITSLVTTIKSNWAIIKSFIGSAVDVIRKAVNASIDYMIALRQALTLSDSSELLNDFPISIRIIVKSLNMIKKSIDLVKQAFIALGVWMDKVIQIGRDIQAWAIKHKEVLIALGVGIGSVATAYVSYIGVIKAFAAVMAIGRFIAFGALIGSIITTYISLIGVMKVFNTVMAISSVVTSAFGTAMAFLTAPVTLILAAIAAVIAAFTYFYRNNETFRKGVQALWEAISNGVSKAINVIVPLVTKWWDFLQTGFTKTFTYIGKTISYIFDGVKSAFYSVINFVIDGINKMIRGLNSVSSYVPGVGGSLQINEFERLGVEQSFQSNQAAESRALVAKSLIKMTVAITGNVDGVHNLKANVSSDGYKSMGGNNAFVIK